MGGDEAVSLDVDDSEVGRLLRDARRDEGVSLRSLAHEVGVSPATLSQLENGKARLSVVRLQRIASTLGRTVEEILSPTPHVAPSVSRPDDDWRRYSPLDLDPVLRAALDVFLRTGYHGASVRDVAAASGLSVSGLYHYHASKQEMLRRILDLAMDDLLWRCRTAAAAGADEVERFCLLVETMALFHTHRREIGFLAASEMRSLEPDAHADMTRRRAAQQRLVDTAVLAGVERGTFATAYPRDASRAVVTMCKAIAEWYNPAGGLTPDDIAARYVRFALDVVEETAPRSPAAGADA